MAAGAGCTATGAGCTTTGAGCTAAGAGAAGSSWYVGLSAALSMSGALLATRTARQALAATTARPISSLVILFMSSVINCRAPLRCSSTWLAEETI